MNRLARLSPRFWRWAKMRFSCAAAATSVERLCRSRSSSSRRVTCLPADGPANAAITSSAVPRTPASIRNIVIPGISPPSSRRPAVRRSCRGGRLLGLLSDERLEAAELAEQRTAARRARLVLALGGALIHGQREQLVERLRQLGGLGHLGERLAELGRLGGSLRIEWEGDVHLALDRMLEILAADLLDGGLHAVGDNDHPRLRRVRLEPGEDADCVTRAGKGELDHDDDDVNV